MGGGVPPPPTIGNPPPTKPFFLPKFSYCGGGGGTPPPTNLYVSILNRDLMLFTFRQYKLAVVSHPTLVHPSLGGMMIVVGRIKLLDFVRACTYTSCLGALLRLLIGWFLAYYSHADWPICKHD